MAILYNELSFAFSGATMKIFIMVCVMTALVYSGIGHASEETSEQAESLYEQALLKNQTGLLIEASVLLTQAISLDDQRDKYFHQRGLSFFGMGETNHGIKDFNHAVDLKTTELSIYLKLINYYMENTQYMAVLIITDQLIANLPDQASGGYYDKGRAYELMAKPQLAVAAYQASIESLEPDQIDFKEFLQAKITNLTQAENKS